MRKKKTSMSWARRRGAAFAVLALLAALGCAGEPEPIRPVTTGPAERLSLESLERAVLTPTLLWQTLEAECDLMVRNRMLPTPNNQVVFRDGRLWFKKPGLVRMTFRTSGGTNIDVVGDGTRYFCNLPAFSDSYGGNYGDPVKPHLTRIHILADDLADALDFSRLLADRALVHRQEALWYTIESIDLLREPVPALKIYGNLTVDRTHKRVMSATKYNLDGSPRVQILYSERKPVKGRDAAVLDVPMGIWLGYPDQATALQIQMTAVKLNVELSDDIFQVPR